MSALLVANQPFLTLLLNTNLIQARALIKTATDSQKRALKEILLNIAVKEFNLATDRVIQRKNKRFLNNFKSKKTIKNKSKQIDRNIQKVHSILTHFKENILPLLT